MKQTFTKEQMEKLTNDRIGNIARDLLSQFETTEIIGTIKQVYLNRLLDIPMNNWSLSNQTIAYVMSNGSKDCRTFLGWKAVGRTVKTGEKAFYILAPVLKTFEKENKETKQKEKYTVLVGFTTRNMAHFSLEQTEGKDLEYIEKPQNFNSMVEIAEKFGVKLSLDISRKGESGSFNLKNNEIRLCTHDTQTFFHEIAHKAHSMIEKLKAGQDKEQEIIAEFSSLVLSELYGFSTENKEDRLKNTKYYIMSYTGKDTNETIKEIMKLLSKIQKIVNIVMEKTIPN